MSSANGGHFAPASMSQKGSHRTAKYPCSLTDGLRRNIHACQVTLDISGSPIGFQWAPGNIQGNLTGRNIPYCNTPQLILHTGSATQTLKIFGIMPSMPNLQHVRHWGLSWLITQAFVCPTQHHEWQPSAFHWRQKLGQIRPKWGQCKQPMLNGTAWQCIQIMGHVDDPLVAITETNILVSCL